MRIGDAVLGMPDGRGAGCRAGGSPPNSMHGNSRTLDFPLPLLEIPPPASSRSRRQCDRSRKEAAVFRATNDAIGALNFMGGGEVSVDSVIHPVSLAEAPQVVQRLHAAVGQMDFEPAGEEASLKAMLRGRGGDYEASDPSQGALASFSIHALSLPETTASAPLVYDLLAGDPEAQQNEGAAAFIATHLRR